MTDLVFILLILLIMAFAAVTADLACNSSSENVEAECFVNLNPRMGE